MPPDNQAAQLHLQVGAGEHADAEELDRLARGLRAEILELDVESVELVKAGDAPPGSKAADAVTVGALAVAVLPTFAPRLVEFLQAWSLRGEGRTVKVKTQVGDRSVELEFSPQVMAQSQMEEMVKALVGALEKKQ